MIGPELVDAAHLVQWASLKHGDPERTFPELVRRLLQATAGVHAISVRAGSGVSLKGWDGEAQSAGSAYLPAGQLRFEFGVGVSPRSKADSDYEKRVRSGAASKDLVFVFVTPRQWSGKEAWATEMRARGDFRDVHVLDADDLAGWLSAVPGVHIWISEYLGLRPRGVETLSRWWAKFARRIDPPLSPDLVLAGRKEEQSELTEFVFGGAGQRTIGARTRDEALVFIAAACSVQDDCSPLIVLYSQEACERFLEAGGCDSVLIVLADGVDIAAATRQGNRVLIPVGAEHARHAGQAIEVPLIPRGRGAEVLSAQGLERDRADRVAGLLRRSFPAFMRELSRDPHHKYPEWSRGPDAATLAPLVLVGAWDATSDGDRQAVAALTESSWESIETCLARWSHTDDPPFVRAGNEWRVAAIDEAFLVLRNAITPSMVDRWRAMACSVLTELDPALELPHEDRMFAPLRGKTRSHSGTIRHGIGRTLAFLGASERAAFLDGFSCAACANLVVARILANAVEDSSAALWQSLSDVLRFLAEAAPDEFLGVVDDDLRQPTPLLASLFQDAEGTGGLFGPSSPHTGLLFALEVLSWSDTYFVAAGDALARLAQLDPGGTMQNRPVQSLKEVLVGWARHTSASTPAKIRFLQRVVDRDPDVGWDLLMALWPSHHSTSMAPCKPEFRDWRPDGERLPAAERLEFTRGMTRAALSLLGPDQPARCAKVIGLLTALPASDRDELLSRLALIAGSSELSGDARHMVWAAVRDEVANHRRFANAHWVFPPDVLQRIEVLESGLSDDGRADRFAYLFKMRPEIADVDPFDFDAGERRARELRSEAVTKVWADVGTRGLETLAGASDRPALIGEAIAETIVGDPGIEAQCFRWLSATDTSLVEMAQGWAFGCYRTHGLNWLKTAVGDPAAQSREARVLLTLVASPNTALWDLVDTLGTDVADDYWRRVPRWPVPEGDADRAVTELLRRGRRWTAVDLLALALHDTHDEAAASTSAIEAALGAASEDPGDRTDQMSPYALGRLLDVLEERGVPADRCGTYEFRFFSVLQHNRRPRALFAALARDPRLFVDCVSLVFRDEEGSTQQDAVRDEAMAAYVWEILSDWDQVPGACDGGTFDGEQLKDWVRQARLLFREARRAGIGDDQIGQVLSASPHGEDGCWPAEAVREVIDGVGSHKLDEAFVIGVQNRRGTTSRGVFDGGEQERELAAKYSTWSSEIRGSSPRTARLLQRIADDYLLDARREDRRADERQSAP